MSRARKTLATSLIFISLFLITGSAWADAADDAVAAVRAFNEAISSRDVDTATAQLAGGGVQFTLRAQHPGAEPAKLVEQIDTYWSTIIPVIFASTSAYSRTIEVLSSEAHGTDATVWTMTRTATTPMGSDVVAEKDFTEAYVVVKMADGWKIAAIADNRQATALEPAPK